jgi:hypothetical protein
VGAQVAVAAIYLLDGANGAGDVLLVRQNGDYMEWPSRSVVRRRAGGQRVRALAGARAGGADGRAGDAGPSDRGRPSGAAAAGLAEWAARRPSGGARKVQVYRCASYVRLPIRDQVSYSASPLRGVEQLPRARLCVPG